MKSKYAKELFEKDCIENGNLVWTSRAQEITSIAEIEMELSRDNLAIWSFCQCCNQSQKDDDACPYSSDLNDNLAWRFRHEGCNRKLEFVELLESN